MPEQYPYPEQGWSTGTMRKVGDPAGGDTQLAADIQMPGQYETQLSAQDEAKFQQWKQKYAPRDSGADYDLRGAFKAGLTPDPKTGHWPDTFKKPNHPTFSDESIYAKDRPDLAGHWEGNTYVHPTGQQPHPASQQGRGVPHGPVRAEAGEQHSRFQRPTGRERYSKPYPIGIRG